VDADGSRAPKVVEVVKAGIIGTFVRVFTRTFPVFVRLVVKLFFTRKICPSRCVSDRGSLPGPVLAQTPPRRRQL